MRTKRTPRRRAETTSLHVTLATEVARRLKTLAAHLDTTPGEVIERALIPTLKGFRVSVGPGSDSPPTLIALEERNDPRPGTIGAEAA